MYRRKPILLSVFLMAAVACAPADYIAAHGAAPEGGCPPEAKSHAPYPDSEQGLKQELKDMLKVARKRDQLRTMVMDLEIPDARAWYFANFGAPGLMIADNYERALTKSEARFESDMNDFSHTEGYFSVKKQNAKKAYPNLVTEPEVFLAAWKETVIPGTNASETPFGYFFFIDGKFRWDSSVAWVWIDGLNFRQSSE